MAERREKSTAVYVPESAKRLADLCAALDSISTGEWIARAIASYHQQQEVTHGPLAARAEQLALSITGKFLKP